jgi:hypothetical protein
MVEWQKRFFQGPFGFALVLFTSGIAFPFGQKDQPEARVAG